MSKCLIAFPLHSESSRILIFRILRIFRFYSWYFSFHEIDICLQVERFIFTFCLGHASNYFSRKNLKVFCIASLWINYVAFLGLSFRYFHQPMYSACSCLLIPDHFTSSWAAYRKVFYRKREIFHSLRER